MGSRKYFLCAAMAVGMAGFIANLKADTLVDTGAGDASSNGDTLYNGENSFGIPSGYNFLAGKFTLTQGAIVDQVAGWMSTFGSGGMDVKIYQDQNNLPGTAVYSKNFYATGTPYTSEWLTFSGFNAALPQGTYWLSFEPTATGGFSGTMPGGAPHPMASYAFNTAGNTQWYNTTSALGMQVQGRTSNVLYGTAAQGLERDTTGQPDNVATVGGNGNFNSEANAGDGEGRGAIVGDSLEAGAFAMGRHQAEFGYGEFGAGQGIAWKPYSNPTSEPMTVRINGELDGNVFNSFGILHCNVDARVAALDPKVLATLIKNSGEDATTYMLGLHESAGHYKAFPKGMALLDDVLYNSFNEGETEDPDLMTFDLNDGTFTLAPGASFVLMFDVYADATGDSSTGGGTGTVDFMHTLHAGPSLFTDENGDPITDIVPGQLDAIEVPEPASVGLLGMGMAGLLGRRRRKSA